jgi:flagellum-specific peptidoglycan hydrolase FlgJ
MAKVIPDLRLLMLILLSVIFNSSFAQTKFVKRFRPLADSLSTEYGIPASVILGISILESSSGTSRNCKLLNNYFGIVGKNKLLKTKGIKTRYKQYHNATASFIDFCHIIKKKKFYKILKGNMNYKLWVDAISKKGYSEIPDIWKERVLTTIRKNKLSTIHY